MSICFCIPARYKSSRLKNKMLLNLDGKNCIQKTVESVEKSEYYNKNFNNIYVLTDSTKIVDVLKSYNCNVIYNDEYCENGTDRIIKNIDIINNKYKYIVNVQGDEPYISHKNIDHCIKKHINNIDNEDIIFTTLHEENNDEEYLKSSASIKLIINKNNDVMYYSRNIIPWNKKNIIDPNYTYKTFTGIYVYNIENLLKLKNIKISPLQKHEDCEQLKILENGMKIRSYPTVEYNEISLNTEKDYDFLLRKYCGKKINDKIKIVVFDFDGVFTDGTITCSDNTVIKSYNGKDSYGLKILKNNNYITGLITAHKTNILKNMTHIYSRLDYISMGNYNKLDVLDEWLKEINLQYENVAYIGDDIPDLEIIKKVGFSACPNDAVKIIKDNANYICENNGGSGAVREFCEKILTL